ncbi:MAG: SpoIID/LytB domain-containing protein [Candidatus Goldbacteria bacterium]|nr:SpoIID/LytB domain-containing protein [Candidatus Goldiibacteriota bacterium]
MKDYYKIKSPVSIEKEKITQTKQITNENIKFNDVIFKILLSKTKNAFIVKSNKEIYIKNSVYIPAAKEINISIKNNNIVVNGTSLADREIELVSDDFIEFNSRKYRGNIGIVLLNNEILIINKVKLDHYLYGVLPSEVIPNWHKECLKAQSVAARTFAIYNKLNSKSPYYDLDANVLSQVYKGVNVETKKTNEAIDETTDEIITYNGEVIQAYFHSNSGGKTASSEEIWGGKLEYLKSKDDEYCKKEKNYRWNITFSSEKISELLKKNKIIIGEIYDIKIMERGESGRIKFLKIYGSSGTITIKGKDFRNFIGENDIKSTNFTITKNNNNFIFDGYGWGHGVGLSQESAKSMAENGWDYKKILKYFYSGVDITKVRLK